MAVEAKVDRSCNQKVITPVSGKIMGEIVGGQRLSPGGLIMLNLRSKNAQDVKITVLSVGSEGWERKGKKIVRVRTTVRVGDIVTVKPGMAKKFREDGKDMAIIKFQDVIAIER